MRRSGNFVALLLLLVAAGHELGGRVSAVSLLPGT